MIKQNVEILFLKYFLLSLLFLPFIIVMDHLFRKLKYGNIFFNFHISTRNIDDRFINLVRVSRKSSDSNVSQSQWVWSDVFAWNNMPLANDRCSKWHLKEPSAEKFTGIIVKCLIYHVVST